LYQTVALGVNNILSKGQYRFDGCQAAWDVIFSPVTAFLGRFGMKQIIATKNAPAAIGPYSQAVRAGDYLYVSGQIPLAADGSAGPDEISAQTRQVLANLKAILSEAGASFADVVKTTVFMTDLEEFAKMNAVYADAFKENPPARATVQVARLPRGVRVEIEAVAWLARR
jgi:2-iminobutanoate/2-iminopropanoate deaminase